jgi:hypothetical protein
MGRTTPDVSPNGRRLSRKGKPPAACDSLPDENVRQWIRWFLNCGMPAAHVAVVLGLSDEEIGSFLTRRAKWIGPEECAKIIGMHASGKSFTRIGRELGRDRQVVAAVVARGGSNEPSSPGPPRLPGSRCIRGERAGKVRRLRRLGYHAAKIAFMLDLDVGDVRSFIARLAPHPPTGEPSVRLRDRRCRKRSRRAKRTKSGSEAKRSDPPLSWGPPSPSAELIEWTELKNRPPAAAESPELLDHQAAAELPTARHQPTPNVWEGATDWTPRGERHGSAKLSEPDVVEVLRTHAAGRSIYSLAQTYAVSQNTIRAIVRGETWTHLQRPPRPAPEC